MQTKIWLGPVEWRVIVDETLQHQMANVSVTERIWLLLECSTFLAYCLMIDSRFSAWHLEVFVNLILLDF